MSIHLNVEITNQQYAEVIDKLEKLKESHWIVFWNLLRKSKDPAVEWLKNPNIDSASVLNSYKLLDKEHIDPVVNSIIRSSTTIINRWNVNIRKTPPRGEADFSPNTLEPVSSKTTSDAKTPFL